MSSRKTGYDLIVDDIKKVSELLEVGPHELTLREYAESGAFSPIDIWHYGGFKNIIKDNFPAPEKDLGVIGAQRSRASYLNKLEKVVSNTEYVSDKLADEIAAAFQNMPLPVRKPLPKKSRPKATKISRENIAFISDTHFGLNIFQQEIPSNSYNWTVASRRMSHFAQQIATYKIEHREDSPQLRLCLGGDLAQGIIHTYDYGTELITSQIHGTTWIVFQMITYLRNYYERIVVECTPCNHLRLTHKGPDRSRAQKWDSFATMVHLALQLAFRNCEDVQFHIPKTPYTEFNVLGHTFFMTHGDTVLEVGNVGRSVNVGRITNSVRAIQASSNKDIKVVMMGHVHTPLNTTLDNGTELVINGTGSGTDSYAQSIGFLGNNPCQVLFESTLDHPVGDFRKVYLKGAGERAELDSIVVPYDGTLRNPPAAKKAK